MKKINIKITRSQIRHFLFILASSAFFMIFVECASAILKTYVPKNDIGLTNSDLYILLNGLLYLLGLFIPFLIYKFVFKVKINFKVILEKGKRLILFRNILISILLGFFVQGIGMGISGLTALIVKSNTAVDFLSALDVIKHPFLFSFSIAIFPAVFEELVFRGLIFNKAKEKLSVISSAILSGILFGLYHLDLQQFFYAAILGFIFALIYNKTNNILDVIIIHFLVDFTQLYIATSTLQSETITNALNESDEIFNETTLALSTFILCAVLLLIFVPLTKTFYKKYESVKDENEDEVENKNNNEEKLIEE